MTIEKLPSGHYRITQKSNGKRYRMTIDHKPTPAEAAQIVSAMVCKSVPSADMTFKEAAETYIESRINVISPATERGYRSMLRSIPDIFKGNRLRRIERQDVQRLINEYSAGHSPKSARNLSGFVSAVLKYHGTHLDPVTLPQKEKKSIYIPTEDDVKAIFAEVKGSEYEIPFMLTALGLRRSEICAVLASDLDGNTLHIEKAKVQAEKGLVVKGTKTTESNRYVILPEYIADKIREKGCAYSGHPNNLDKVWNKMLGRIGLPRFPMHKMRHFFASYMHSLGYSDASIQEMGGWKTDSVMKAVYRHAMSLDEAKQSAANDISKLML